MSPSPAERFALTFLGLCQAVAASVAFGLMTSAMIVLVWARVRKAEGLFLALLARVAAGRWRGGWVRAGVPRGSRDDGVGTAGGARLPTRFGWLMAKMPFVAAGYGSQLQALLDEPAMAALVAETAQARRILGPVCRMLGVVIPGCTAPLPPALLPPAPKAMRVRPKRARVALDFGRIPLPRGVLTAARRQGFGKIR